MVIKRIVLLACTVLASRALADLPDEVSLKADRDQLAKERKDIPPEKRKENDELAFVRQLMADGEREPGEIRDRFQKEVRTRREKYDKLASQAREEYDRDKKKKRDAFLQKQKDDRESFMSNGKDHLDAAKRKSFFDDQDAKRSSYFSAELDRGKEFESKTNQARKDFEAYIVGKTNLFNQELRDYTTTYYDRKKQLDIKQRAADKAKAAARESARTAPGGMVPGSEATESYGGPGTTGNTPSNPELDEFKKIPKSPATPLGTQ